jgi:S-DNA-T family DNA segregation ATPase FtsK/SpoIIIE
VKKISNSRSEKLEIIQFVSLIGEQDSSNYAYEEFVSSLLGKVRDEKKERTTGITKEKYELFTEDGGENARRKEKEKTGHLFNEFTRITKKDVEDAYKRPYEVVKGEKNIRKTEVINNNFEPEEEIKLDNFNSYPENEQKIEEDLKIYSVKDIHKFENSTPLIKTIKVEDETNSEEEEVYEVPDDGIYHFPLPDLLSKNDNLDFDNKPEWLLRNIEIINETLSARGIDGKVTSTRKGPRVTRYEISLSAETNVNIFKSNEKNFQLALAAESINIMAPIPGKSAAGIEIPNSIKDEVKLGDCVNQPGFLNDRSNLLKIPLGITIDGEVIYFNLNKMPHGLIAGTSGSGKSVFIDTVIVSLLLRNRPDQLKLILIDPKFTGLNIYRDLPHLACPVITDMKLARSSFEWAIDLMESRYRKLKENDCRDADSFNRAIQDGIIAEAKMYSLLIIIEEFSDLVGQVKDIVELVIRLAQKARAANIHLLIAVQRPTVDIINGSIKGNLDTRFAFKTFSNSDSQVILDQPGAEKLLGYGDMIYKKEGKFIRVQAPYVDESDIKKVTNFIKRYNDSMYLFYPSDSILSSYSRSLPHPKTEAILKYIIEKKKASKNDIMEEFNLAYSTVIPIFEEFENKNIIRKEEGTRASTILVSNFEEGKRKLYEKK